MSKKTNTLVFILAATVFNILVTIVCFLVLFILFVKFLAPIMPETAAGWGFPIIFIGSIALSFLVYRVLLKFLLKKFNPEKYFDPIFGRRRPPMRRD
jgi:hypothetical protein